MPGKPAARLTDTVAHPLPPILVPGPGSLTVLIGFLPAWRAVSPAAVAALQAAQKTADTSIQIAENAAKAGAGTPAGPGLRVAAETAKGVAAAAMSSTISSAAAGADLHLCLTPWPIPPHALGIDIQGSPTVLVNGFRIGRQGDQLLEAIGGTNSITGGCPTVLVGAAGIVGNVPAGQAACVAARAGRNPPPGALDPNGNQIQPGTAGQSYNNCGCETSRQLINQATPANISQEALLNQAMAGGQASQVPGNLYASGGTNPQTRQQILANNGVPSHLENRTMGNLEASVAAGQGNIVVVDSQTLWTNGTTPPSTGDHVVVVTGVEYDDNGNVKSVIINDTGAGTCSQKVPANVWNQATAPAIGNWQTNVTDKPVW
jgi:uncharacterized Zn-binding protein involved in type VI secretion